MKKVLAFAMAFVMMLSLAGCGATPSSSATAATSTSTSASGKTAATKDLSDITIAYVTGELTTQIFRDQVEAMKNYCAQIGVNFVYTANKDEDKLLEACDNYIAMQNFETITDLTMLWKNCYCFKKIMTVKTVNTFVHKQDHDIPLRIYLPHGEGPFKVMVFYHGGGWMMNSLDVYDYVPRYFAQYGNLLVITPEYRLAPEHRFPQGLQDCYDTLVWTHGSGVK